MAPEVPEVPEVDFTYRCVRLDGGGSTSVEIATHRLTYPPADLQLAGYEEGPWMTLLVGNGCEDGMINLTPAKAREVIVSLTDALADLES